MTLNLEELGIARLSVEQRIILVEMIWKSIDAEQQTSDWHTDARHELQRRLAEHDADPGDVVPWETVKSDALRRLGKSHESVSVTCDIEQSARPRRSRSSEVPIA